MIYLDSSALVKLVAVEVESPALERHLVGHADLVSSALAYVEVVRAARKRDDEAVARARQLLQRVQRLAVDDQLLRAAADLAPDSLRALDAVHVAAARALGDDLAELITYDRRMADAARSLGIAVVAPA